MWVAMGILAERAVAIEFDWRTTASDCAASPKYAPHGVAHHGDCPQPARELTWNRSFLNRERGYVSMIFVDLQYNDDVELAHRLADAADVISAQHFNRSPATTRKTDGSVVSAADLAVEEELLDILRRHRGDDGVVSEESGTVAVGTNRQWILDPIDGTEPFLAGQRSWGTHIALIVDGELEVAIITRPTEHRRWWAVRGQGAWSSSDNSWHVATPLTVSRTYVLGEARIGGLVDPGSEWAAAIARHGEWVADPLGDIIALIEGRVDVVIAPSGAIWDHAPQVLLTTEAGGRYTDRFGGKNIDAQGGIYTNGLLTEQVRAVPELCPTNSTFDR